MRRSRLVLGCLVALALSPGIVLRDAWRPPVYSAPIEVVRVPLAPVEIGPFEAQSVWQIDSANEWFGGFSALIAFTPEKLLAASDTGRLLRLDLGRETPMAKGLGFLRGRDPGNGPETKALRDVEALAYYPATGQIWAGLESANAIERYRNPKELTGFVLPRSMRQWGANSGPEAFTRLANGRFLAIEERALSWRGDTHQAVLFAGDPVAGRIGERLIVDVPGGYRPVDLAPLENGRALVLLRKVVWTLPPGFDTAIGIIDTDRRDAGGALAIVMMAELGDRVPQDNYEGLAVIPTAGGRDLWLISDDNFMASQRTLLLKLRWPEREKARE